MTADASGVLLADIVALHNNLVVTRWAVIGMVVLTVAMFATYYAAKRIDVKRSKRGRPVCMSSLCLDVASVALIVGAFAGLFVVVFSLCCLEAEYSLGEAIRVYESVYGPLPEGLF